MPAPTAGDTGMDDELDHIYCCDPDRALCGRDISGVEEEECEEWSCDDHPCVVCEDLEGRPCERCGQ